MPRRKRLTRKPKTRKATSARGRKPIFTPAQKRVLDRLIRVALKEQLRAAARSM